MPTVLPARRRRPTIDYRQFAEDMLYILLLAAASIMLYAVARASLQGTLPLPAPAPAFEQALIVTPIFD